MLSLWQYRYSGRSTGVLGGRRKDLCIVSCGCPAVDCWPGFEFGARWSGVCCGGIFCSGLSSASSGACRSVGFDTGMGSRAVSSEEVGGRYGSEAWNSSAVDWDGGTYLGVGRGAEETCCKIRPSGLIRRWVWKKQQ